ncbi:phage head-tail adapter protein [Streptococcus suis]|nr:phage head-tail adapter protein [Streptococcus suis]HEL1640799.1 phage head-tail adapter protein [Streptococcus suis]
MRWNEDCILLERVSAGLDDLLQETFVDKETEISCNKRSLTRSEYYFASQSGMRPSMVLEVHNFEYDGQKFLLFEGCKYKVLKTFENGDNVELTCEEVANGC